ncbi:NnrS family protein [Roseovarius spongiae]|uniref:NnrS family protein n=1 Tax=Roseovarius spongiae TaxID=2320272 RepID=A0A3A8AWV8_9RHOB|nr:NnrS family protein [Roseovarius spongiae]RKF16166.1 NnrS family protein [Roseovarius spongiae]
MAQTSAEQMRQWQGPAILSFGFRPFFLFGALWAAGAMVLWIMALSGALDLPSRFDAVTWHAHAFLFGYLGAVIAGFLLTAVPNWTGRLPVVGWYLGGLFALWAAGRVAVTFSAHLPAGVAAAVDLAFPILLGAVILREIVAGKNWRNLVVLMMLGVFTLANLLFHLENARGVYAAQGIGLRLGVATVLMMIGVIGGRIVPSFTRNWLVKAGHDARPAPPMQRLDKAVLLLSALALGLWVALPEDRLSGAALIVMGALQAVRLARWQGARTAAEPLVLILHAAYGLIPLGALLMGIAILGLYDAASAQHVWMSGAMGLMTMAVMSRATLGHTGQALHAGAGTVAIYGALFGSVLVRALGGVWPEQTLYEAAGALWIVGFAGFAALYGPALLRYRKGA